MAHAELVDGLTMNAEEVGDLASADEMLGIHLAAHTVNPRELGAATIVVRQPWGAWLTTIVPTPYVTHWV